MERQDEVLVIRFPPVAPPPFEPRPVPAAELESAAPASVAGARSHWSRLFGSSPPLPASETARQIGVKDADAEADLEADVVEQAISEPTSRPLSATKSRAAADGTAVSLTAVTTGL